MTAVLIGVKTITESEYSLLMGYQLLPRYCIGTDRPERSQSKILRDSQRSRQILRQHPTPLNRHFKPEARNGMTLEEATLPHDS